MREEGGFYMEAAVDDVGGGGWAGANSNDRKIAWSTLLIFFHAPCFQPTSRPQHTCDVFLRTKKQFHIHSFN